VSDWRGDSRCATCGRREIDVRPTGCPQRAEGSPILAFALGVALVAVVATGCALVAWTIGFVAAFVGRLG
jgi:hypothetical protein